MAKEFVLSALYIPARLSTRRIVLAVALAAAACLSYAAVALALVVGYGGYNLAAGYPIQAPGDAHTYVFNTGGIQDGAHLACQLFNNSGYNNVTHGDRQCSQTAPSLPYKFARVYNQSYDGATRITSGTANT
jgi:hypothetical protein